MTFCWFWLFHILMLYNMIILYFRLPYFYVSNSAFFLHSASVLSFYIDVVLKGCGICMGCVLAVRQPKPPLPLLTANHRRFLLDWARRWQNLTVTAWSHAIWGDESRFQLYPVDGRMRVRRLTGERFQQHLAGNVFVPIARQQYQATPMLRPIVPGWWQSICSKRT